jgi:hypothetical protein
MVVCTLCGRGPDGEVGGERADRGVERGSWKSPHRGGRRGPADSGSNWERRSE